jgi:hypothetical protein
LNGDGLNVGKLEQGNGGINIRILQMSDSEFSDLKSCLSDHGEFGIIDRLEKTAMKLKLEKNEIVTIGKISMER